MNLIVTNKQQDKGSDACIRYYILSSLYSSKYLHYLVAYIILLTMCVTVFRNAFELRDNHTRIRWVTPTNKFINKSYSMFDIWKD